LDLWILNFTTWTTYMHAWVFTAELALHLT
jgi:hypothetical protein